MTVRADLHIHSCLSPCGDLEMSPRAIAARALEAGLSLIALTDHNTARNVPAFAQACDEAGLAAIYGCEVSTAEEAHVLALFGDPAAAVDFGETIYASLPSGRRDPARFGDQVVVTVDEEIVDTLKRFLIAASAYQLHELGAMIHERGGIFIPAHIDRSMFSVWSQLGFLPPDSYDALEMVSPDDRSTIDPGDHTVICNSDAHLLANIGRRSFSFEADAPSYASLREALERNRVRVSC